MLTPCMETRSQGLGVFQCGAKVAWWARVPFAVPEARGLVGKVG